MTEHDNLSQTLFIFGLIKYVQLTLLHCLIVSEFRRYSPLTVFGQLGNVQFNLPFSIVCTMYSMEILSARLSLLKNCIILIAITSTIIFMF